MVIILDIVVLVNKKLIFFKFLGIGVVIAKSFRAIYERNAINNVMLFLLAYDITNKINYKDEISVDFITDEITDVTQGKTYYAKPISKSQIKIYKRGGLLNLI